MTNSSRIVGVDRWGYPQIDAGDGWTVSCHDAWGREWGGRYRGDLVLWQNPAYPMTREKRAEHLAVPLEVMATVRRCVALYGAAGIGRRT